MSPIKNAISVIIDGNQEYREEISSLVHRYTDAKSRIIHEFSSAKPALEILKEKGFKPGLLVVGTNTAEDIAAFLLALPTETRERTVVYSADEEFLKECFAEGFKTASKKKATAYLEDQIVSTLYQ